MPSRNLTNAAYARQAERQRARCAQGLHLTLGTDRCLSCGDLVAAVEHAVSKIGTSRVGPTYQGAGGRTVFYGYCTCGAGTTRSASRASVEKKLAAHAAGDNRGIYAESGGDAGVAAPASPPVPTPDDAKEATTNDDLTPEEAAAQLDAELAADVTRTRSASVEGAPRGFDPACLFLLDLSFPNLFERVSARAGEDYWWRCKGCGATVKLTDRKKHHAAHNRTRARAANPPKGASDMASNKNSGTTEAGPTLREQYVAAVKEEFGSKITVVDKPGYARVNLGAVNLGFVNGKKTLLVDILGGRTGTSAKVKVAGPKDFPKAIAAMKKHHEAVVKQIASKKVSGGKASGKSSGKSSAGAAPAATADTPMVDELTDQAVAVQAQNGDTDAARELASREKTTVGEITPVDVKPDPKPEPAKRGRRQTAAAKK